MFRSRESKAAAATVAHEKEKRQPKYIGNLLKQAKMRAVESDRIFDRKLQKEREEQDKVRKECCTTAIFHSSISLSLNFCRFVYCNRAIRWLV